MRRSKKDVSKSASKDQAPIAFINYSQPDDLNNAKQRFAIQSFVSENFRRRSRPVVVSRKPARKYSFSPPHSASSSHGEASESKARTRGLELQLKHRQPLPLALQLSGGRGDPFDAYPIEATDCVPGAIDYYTQVCVSGRGLVFGKGLFDLTQMFSMALQSPALFESLVAMSQSYLIANKDLSGPTKEVLYHRGQALARLRQSMMDPQVVADNTPIYTAIMLLGIDYLHEDLTSFATHLNGIIMMIKLRGGITALDADGSLMKLIQHARSTWLLMTGTAFRVVDPVLDAWENSDDLSIQELQEMETRLPNTLRKLVRGGHYSPELLQIIGKVFRDDGLIRVSPRAATTMYEAFRANPGSIDDCMYHAVIIYFLNSNDRTRRSKTYNKILHRLGDAVKLFRSEDEAEQDCMVWILTVAGAGCRGSYWEDSFSFMGYMLQQFQKTHDQEEWLDVLHNFFWSDRLASDWSAAWTMAILEHAEVQVLPLRDAPEVH